MDRDILRLGGIGILTQADVAELTAGVRRVYDLMQDGEWHSATSIRRAAGRGGAAASEGLRRMRELRQWFDVERRRMSGTREFLYRLKPKGIETPDLQQGLSI